MIVLDTNALLWIFGNQAKLSNTAERRISTETDLRVSTITWIEVARLIARGRLSVDKPCLEFLDELNAHVASIPIGTEIACHALNHGWPMKDPADQIIASTAALAGVDLLTSDGQILDAYDRAIW